MSKVINVTNQEMLDAIPVDADVKIIVQFGNWHDPAIVRHRYRNPVHVVGDYWVAARGNSTVTACENSTVTAWGNSTVAACENSTVTAWGNSTVAACENSTVTAWGNSTVTAWGNSTVTACENSTVAARGNSTVTACENSTVAARGNSTVTAWGNSTVTAWGNSTVAACENSTVTACENSTVTAWGNSTVTARGNSQIIDRTDNNGKNLTIKSPNARIIYDPRTIEEYMYAYGLDFDEKADTVKLYKAVHKDRNDGKYHADHHYTFLYEIGEMVEADFLDEDPHIDCGHGIHMAYPEWCVLFGNDWNDIAILELEIKKSDIVVPYGGSGKVRALRAKVLREYPLDECGVEGRVLAKRLARKEGR